MKKYLLMLASAATALMLFADNASAQLKVGIGYSLGQTSAKSGNTKETANLNGFNVGGVYEFDFLEGNWGNFGLQAGLNYEFLGDGEKTEEYGLTINARTSEHYLNVPVMAKYGYDIVPGVFGAYIAAGPTFAFGLASQTSRGIKGDVLGESIDGKVIYHWYSGKVTSKNLSKDIVDALNNQLAGTSGYGWFDVKLGLAVGFEIIEAIDLKLGYNWGLVNRYAGEGKDQFKLHTNNFYIGLSYMF